MKLATVCLSASLVALALPAGQAHAEMGACQGAYVKQSLEDQVRLYSICLDGLWDSARAGAHHNRGVAYLELGQIQQAISDFDMSLLYDGRYGLAHFNRAAAYAQLGNYPLAIRDLDRALELRPSRIHVDARLQRGALRQAQGDHAGALEDFDAVIDRNMPWFDPERAHKEWQITQGMLAKASLLATTEDAALRDPMQAVSLAEEAVQWDDTALGRSILAEAYAANGRFEDAAREQSLAIQMAMQEGVADAEAAMQNRLSAYEGGQSYQVADAGCGAMSAYCDGSAWRVEEMALRVTRIYTGFATAAEMSAAGMR